MLLAAQVQWVMTRPMFLALFCSTRNRMTLDIAAVSAWHTARAVDAGWSTDLPECCPVPSRTFTTRI